MTPATIAEAVYELGQAATTREEARLGGSELGTRLANQSDALKGVCCRGSEDCRDQVDFVLLRLTKSDEAFHAEAAQAALDAWRLRLKAINAMNEGHFSNTDRT